MSLRQFLSVCSTEKAQKHQGSKLSLHRNNKNRMLDFSYTLYDEKSSIKWYYELNVLRQPKTAGTRPAEIAGVRLIANGLNRPRDQVWEK